MLGFSLLFIISLSHAEVLRITQKNIEGQKKLYEEGWFIVTSPVEAWNYAIENNEISRQAFKRALAKINPNQETFQDRVERAKETTINVGSSASYFSNQLVKRSSKLQRKSFLESSENFKKSWKKLNLGYVHYKKSNQQDLESLKKINVEFFGKVKNDFTTTEKAMKPILGFLLGKSDISWKNHFKEGKYSFKEQYEKSGSRGNSLVGLWDILVGYASWSFHAVFSPTAQTVYQETKSIPYYTIDLILKSFIASHNVIHSLGSNVYYSTKLGYNVISPTLESGYLASLALLGVVNGAVTSNVLKSVGLINKISVKAIAPVIGGAQLTIEEIASRAQDSVTYLVHGIEGVGEVVFEKVETGVVLGYSALSQLPPQLLLTSVNTAILLVYDGPRLMIAKVSGFIGDKKVEELPVGSVLDVKKMKEEGLRVETLSQDPKVIKKVLEHVE